MEHFVGFRAPSKIRDRFDFIMDSYNQKLFDFSFGAAFFQNVLLLFFYVNDDNFFQGFFNDSSHLRKLKAECRYSLFLKSQRVFVVLKKTFSKL